MEARESTYLSCPESFGHVRHEWEGQHVIDARTGADGVFMALRHELGSTAGPTCQHTDTAYIRGRDAREFAVPLECVRLAAQ
ncbi:hypothetical protein [Streptomyces bambusae]|uniref:Uncharacterized protein n=1 Tax=Streptomyces bambusae TaxID=1550616 RepID=A0ABS6ZB02_9ACTN|nr:hypothetical protein [Streptomyces bambusae]MBW5484939.1 hypothetical protein [Streptomyces bambusae]